MSFRVAMLDPSAFTIPYDLHLCRALSGAGNDVTLFTRPCRSVDYFSRAPSGNHEITQLGYDTVEHFYRLSERFRAVCPIPLLRNGLKAAEHVWDMAALRRTLIRIQPDIIHFQWTIIPAIDRHFVHRLRSIAPCLLTVHDANAFLNPTSRLQRMNWRAVLGAFNKLVVHTQSGKQTLVDKGVEEATICVIPHGLLGHARGLLDHGTDQSGEETCVLLAFGAIKPYKGIDVLIRALAELPEAVRRKIRLVIAGNPGTLEKKLRSLAVECGVDESIEWVLRFIRDEEIPALFHRSRAVVFPYREIDASGALMTALPYAKTIVASRLGLFDELLENGETALLVEPDNPSALASALAAVAEDPVSAREMGRRAANVANEVCDWACIAALLMNAYHGVSKSG